MFLPLASLTLTEPAGLARKWGLGFQQPLPGPLPTSSPSAWEQHPVWAPPPHPRIHLACKPFQERDTTSHSKTKRPLGPADLYSSSLRHPLPPTALSWTLLTPPLSYSSPLTPVFLCSVPALVQWDDLVTFRCATLQKLAITCKLKSNTLHMASVALPWALPACSVPTASALHFTRAAELSKMVVSGCLQLV